MGEEDLARQLLVEKATYDQNLETLAGQLQQAEKKRAEFRVKYVDLLPGDGGASRLEIARASLRTLTGQLLDAQAKRVTIAKELAATPQLVVTESEGGPGGPGGTGSRLDAAERTLSELRLRLTENHPDVVLQRNLVALIRSGKAGPGEAGATARSGPRNKSVPNPVYEKLKVQAVENDSIVASLQRQVADATTDSQRLDELARSAPGLQAEFINMNRDYDVLRKNYDDLISRRESMRISSAADTNADKIKVQIIDPPQVPQNPVAPKRALLISGVFVAALAAGAALALLLVQMDQSFHSTDDLRDLGFPVVGGVSFLAASVPFRRKLFAVVSFAIAVMIPGVIYGGLLMRLIPQVIT